MNKGAGIEQNYACLLSTLFTSEFSKKAPDLWLGEKEETGAMAKSNTIISNFVKK